MQPRSKLQHHKTTCPNVVQAAVPHKHSLPAQLVFFRLVTIHTEEYVTIWGCAAVSLLMNLLFKNTHINKRRWNVPVAFHIFDQLDQPRYRLPIATPIYWQSCSPQTFLPRFTTKATNMVNYSLSKDLLFPQLKHGVELETCRNVCIPA